MNNIHTTDGPKENAMPVRLAASATLHCLTGCGIGEILGMVIGTGFNWSNAATVVLSIALAFFFGYALTLQPLLSTGMALRLAVPLAVASDTISITIMEIVDNAAMLAIPGAMNAPISSKTFWVSLLVSTIVAGLFTFPANLWLIQRGQGHARVHRQHDGPT
jgi:hypothetical protein